MYLVCYVDLCANYNMFEMIDIMSGHKPRARGSLVYKSLLLDRGSNSTRWKSQCSNPVVKSRRLPSDVRDDTVIGRPAP